MGTVITVLIIVAVLLLGYHYMDKDDDHDEWRGY